MFSTTSMSADSSAGPRAGSGDSGLTGNLSANSAYSRAPTSCSTGGEEDHHPMTKNRVSNSHAPPLPVHRYPSWEDRIYQVASEAGILDSSHDHSGTTTLLLEASDTVTGDSMNNNNQILSNTEHSANVVDGQNGDDVEEDGGIDANHRLSTASLRGSLGFGSDVSVPVYASVKGVSCLIDIK